MLNDDQLLCLAPRLLNRDQLSARENPGSVQCCNSGTTTHEQSCKAPLLTGKSFSVVTIVSGCFIFYFYFPRLGLYWADKWLQLFARR